MRSDYIYFLCWKVLQSLNPFRKWLGASGSNVMAKEEEFLAAEFALVRSDS